MRTLGSVVWIAHWIAPVVTPIWWFLGSSLSGGGWWTIGMLVASPFALVLGLVGPIIGVAARPLRRARAVPPGYAIATLALWVVAFLLPLAAPSVTDASSGDSALSAIGLPGPVSDAVFAVLSFTTFAGWVVSIVLLGVQVRWVARRWPPRTNPMGTNGLVAE